MLRIKRLRVLSVAKIVGGIYAGVGLLVAAIFAVVFLLAALVGSAATEEFAAAGLAGGVFGALVILIFAPLFYGVLGFVAGIVGAFVYNLMAGWIGGIEVEVETITYGGLPTGTPPPAATPASSTGYLSA